jgi:outer membrane receptor protein involved in Fe transport
MFFRRFAVFLIMFLTLVSARLVGQTSQGTLAGVARDTSGAVVPKAKVTVTDQATGILHTAMTANDGAYRFDALAPGPYTITVESKGFQTSSVKDVQVLSTSITSYDVTVKVGGTTEAVEVEADTATINTETGALSGTVNSIEIDKLPVFSESPYELAVTVPGVQPVSASGFSNGIDIQVNGARPRANNFLLDGQEINDVSIAGQAFQPLIPDMFSSLTVLTNASSAEYGRAGGAVVNLVTKQGTNTYHGSVFERYTGSGLNARSFGLRGSSSQKARYDTHTYGFTGGGAIFKDKLFAFGGLALQRYYGSQTPGTNLLPDANGYALLQTITGQQAAQVALLDQYLSNGAYLTQSILQTNLATSSITLDTASNTVPGCVAPCKITEATYRRPNAATQNPDTQWGYRIDYTPWQHDSFVARYIHDRSSFSPDFLNNGSALAGFDTLQGGPSELGEGIWTHIFTPNLLNEFRAAETRLNFQFAPTPQTLANPLFSLYTIGIAGFPSLGPNQNFPQGRGEELYQFQDTVGWQIGRHSLRIGADVGRQLEKDLVSQNAKGTLGFTAGGAGTALGNFLLNQLGTSGTATKTFGPTRVDPHNWRTAGFAQDDIKLNADFTLNLGVRYDYLSNPENSLPYPGIDPNNVFAPINTVVMIKNDYNNIAPRIGFAYSPHYGGFFGDGKSVIRGGVGIFYDSTFSNILVNSAQSSPNAPTGTLTSTATGGLTNATGLIPSITATFNANSSVTSEVNNLVNPITYQYNLGIERELPYSINLAVRYIGVRGEKLFANQQYNYFNGATGTRLNTTRGAIVARGNFADSDYNGLSVEVNHNFKHGLLIRSNYVYGKDLDDGSEVFTPTGDNTSYTANLAPGGRRQDWGPSAYDHRHFLSISYVYAPVGLHSSNGFANAALGALTRHWVLSGVQQFQSGIYSTISPYGVSVGGVDENGDGSTTNDRPLVGNHSAPFATAGIDGHFIGGTTGQYYDVCNIYGTAGCNTAPQSVAAFRWLVPYMPLNQYLTQEIGRNSYSNPGTITTNLALEKGIGLDYVHFERGTLTLRAEVSNVGNHNNAGPLNTDLFDIPTGNFLNVHNSRYGGRTMVLWAKVNF